MQLQSKQGWTLELLHKPNIEYLRTGDTVLTLVETDLIHLYQMAKHT